MRFEDATRKTFTGRISGATWYKNIRRIYVTLDVAKSGAKTRASAEKAARKICKTNGFPEWECKDVKRTRGLPGICLVLGEVKG